MGLFWDLIQQSQISDATQRADTLEARVHQLEREVADNRAMIHELLKRLESAVGEDIDADGRVG